MKRSRESDDPRRRLLLDLLAAGLLAPGLGADQARANELLGNRPNKLPPGQSVYRLSGSCTVNDREATREMRIGAGDTLRTGKDSEIVFVVGSTSMLLRSDSQVVLQGGPRALTAEPVPGLKLLNGKLLSVFAPGSRQIQTGSATIRISGTGVYLETDPEQTYFCTCYGVAEVTANDDPSSTERVVARHHDQPLLILAGARSRGRSIRRAAFVNHSDEELALVEALVGRHPPFVHPTEVYERPRPDTDYNR